MRRHPSPRIPSLDGLRAVSIAVVILGHLTGTKGFPAWVGQWVESDYVDLAHLGVRVFFVISGFLITGLLIDEKRRTGRIALSRFYLRRTLRIFPPYYAYLAVIAVLTAAGMLAVSSRDFAHAVSYTMNYAGPHAWEVGHLWSLAVEEQFYLLWPAVIALAGFRRARTVAIAVVCLVPMLRVGEFMMSHDWLPMIGRTFETTADSLAMGCLLSLEREALFANRWYRRIMLSRWGALACVVLGYVIAIKVRPGLLLGRSLVGAGIVLGIDRCVRLPDGRLGRLLNARPVVFVGTISYSLYLWQQLFINRNSAHSVFPWNVIAVVPAALLSYYVIERPSLRFRARLERWLAARRTIAAAGGAADHRAEDRHVPGRGVRPSV